MLWKNCLSPVSTSSYGISPLCLFGLLCSQPLSGIWARLEAEVGFLGHSGGRVMGQMPVPTEGSLGQRAG